MSPFDRVSATYKAFLVFVELIFIQSSILFVEEVNIMQDFE